MFRQWTIYARRRYCLFMSSCWCLLALSLLFLTACGGGIYHTVKPGQTLYRISRTYGISEPVLAKANNIADPTRLLAGTRLFIPGADRVRNVPVVRPATTQLKAAKKSKPVKKQSTVTRQPAKKTTNKVTQSKRTAKKTVKSTSIKRLQWPLRGKVIRSFSATAKAGSGKGIEIAVRVGSPVQAAEAGKVIYSGDGIHGYGHLIILQHENDLFTVYGFNQRNYVRQGDFVSKGEKIALSGVPPAGGTPRVHFEVRKGKLAVNPILYLP